MPNRTDHRCIGNANEFLKGHLLFAALACLLSLPFEGKGSNMIIRLSESEAVDTPSQADWHTEAGQGWYIKEHYHAEDFAFMVCDEQSVGAKIVLDLGREIPAGIWRVFVRHIKNRRGGTNVIGIALGGLENKDKFTASGKAEMSWENKDNPRDYRWAEVRITTDKPTRFLQITAMSVVREGIGDVPEYPLKVVLLDTIVVTDRKDITIDKGKGGRYPNVLIIPGRKDNNMVDTTPKSERSHVWLAPDPEGPERVRLVGENAAVTRETDKSGTAGNLIKGGGFDAALNPYWFITAYYATRDLIDESSAVQGVGCLRLKGYSSVYNSTPAFNVTLVSAPFETAPGAYTCSFMKRADDTNMRFDVVIGIFDPEANQVSLGKLVVNKSRIEAGEAWTNIGFDFEVKQSSVLQVHIKADSFAGEPDSMGLSKGSVWLDAFSIAPTGAVAFAPALPVELGVHSRVMRLYYPGTIEFLLRAAAYDKRNSVNVAYEVLDIEWQRICEGRLQINLDARGVGETALTIPFDGHRGAYLLKVRATDVPESEQVLDFALVDDPKQKKARANMGLYIGFNHAYARYFSRAGAGYLLTLTDGPFRGYRALPGKVELKDPNSEQEVLAALDNAEYAWFDGALKSWLDMGIEVIPEFLASEMPDWAKGNPRVFGKHVGNMVRHYRKLGIGRWITGDEVGSAYLPYHQEAAKAIREEDPHAKIMISTCPGLIEEWFEKDGVNTSAIGGSYWTSTKWQYLAMREACKRLDRPFWNIGVGWGSRPAYIFDPHNIRMNMGRGRFDVVANILYCHAIAAPELLVTYCNRFTNGRSFGTGDMYTGTFVPHGVYFAAAAGFIRGTEPGAGIDLKNASDLDAFWLTRDGRTVVVISQSQSFWGIHRGESAFRLRIEADPSKLGFYNVDLAEVDPPARQGNGFGWDLPVLGMLMIEDRGLGKDALLKAVSELTAVKTHGTRYVLLGREDGGLDLGLWLRNGLGRDLSGTIAVEERVALAKGVSRSKRLDLGEGESKLVRFALASKMGVSRPIGNLIAGYTFSDNETFAVGDEAHLWAACARRCEGDLPLRGIEGWNSKELVGYVMGSGRIGGGYGLEQVRKGGTWFISSETREMGLRVFARWCEGRVQLGFDLDELMSKTCRSIDIMFDPGLVDVLAGRTPTQRARTITITDMGSSPQVKMEEIGAGGPVSQPCDMPGAGVKVGRKGSRMFVEVSLPPGEALGRVPAVGESVGFNVLVRGPNPYTGEEMEFVYSGRPNYRPFDSEGWGQLVFLSGLK